jgi:hypothetical protein
VDVFDSREAPYLIFSPMKPKRIVLLLLCALAVLVALIWPSLPLASETNRLATLAGSGSGFDSVPLSLTSADIKFLNGAKADIRHVKLHSGGSLVLTVIDGSENRHAVHDPSYCLAGGGWQITEKKRISMRSGEATWMKLVKGEATSEAIWFFDDEKSQFTSPLAYWARTSARRMTLGRSGSEPRLITLRALPGEAMNWDEVREQVLPAMGFK